VQLKFGELVASHICHHNSLVQVVSAALGSGSEPKPKMIDLPTDPEMGILALNRLLTFG
jgi:hypothetical protein